MGRITGWRGEGGPAVERVFGVRWQLHLTPRRIYRLYQPHAAPHGLSAGARRIIGDTREA